MMIYGKCRTKSDQVNAIYRHSQICTIMLGSKTLRIKSLRKFEYKYNIFYYFHSIYLLYIFYLSSKGCSDLLE